MEVRSESVQLRCDKLPGQVIPRSRLQVWFIWVCSSILIWTCLVQLVVVGELWHPHLLAGLWNHSNESYKLSTEEKAVQLPLPLLPASEYLLNFVMIFIEFGLFGRLLLLM